MLALTRPSTELPPLDNCSFGDGYNGGAGRRWGELYSAKAGFVVNDSSLYGFADVMRLFVEKADVGDNDGGVVVTYGV